MRSDVWRSELIARSPVVHARVAGAVGAVVLGSGSFAGFVSSNLIVNGDPAATSSNIVASETLFRLGIVGSLVMMIAWLFYALLLYRLLRPVDRSHAMTMLALVVVSVPIYMLNEVNLFATLSLASRDLFDQVGLFLDAYRFGNIIAAIFFGLWLLPLGLLVYRSGFLPGFLGLLLILGTLGYLVLFVQAFFFPGAERTLWSNPLLVITHVSELALLLWLLIKGVDGGKWEQTIGRGAGSAGQPFDNRADIRKS